MTSTRNNVILDKFTPTSTNGKGENTGNASVQNIFVCKVVSNQDPLNLGRIQVQIPNLDVKPYFCYPLLPKNNFILPKPDETVVVFILDMKKPEKERFYIGSIFSSMDKLREDTWFRTARAVTPETIVPDTTKDITKIPEARDVYPTKDTEVANIGRNNTDLLHKDNEVILRAGRHKINQPLEKNNDNPAYVKLSIKNDSSNAVMQADNIFLLSHRGNPKFSSDVSMEELDRLIEEADNIPYGKPLVRLAQIMKDFMLNHTHPFGGEAPVKGKLYEELNAFDVDTILNRNIRIN